MIPPFDTDKQPVEVVMVRLAKFHCRFDPAAKNGARARQRLICELADQCLKMRIANETLGVPNPDLLDYSMQTLLAGKFPVGQQCQGCHNFRDHRSPTHPYCTCAMMLDLERKAKEITEADVANS